MRVFGQMALTGSIGVLSTGRPSDCAGISYTSYFPTITKTLTSRPIIALVLVAPPYALAAGLSIVVAWHADKHVERCAGLPRALLTCSERSTSSFRLRAARRAWSC